MSQPLVNAASQMFIARMQCDVRDDPELLKRNPQARALYFKGVEDVLTTIEALVADGVDPVIMSTVLQALHSEVKQNAPNHH